MNYLVLKHIFMDTFSRREIFPESQINSISVSSKTYTICVKSIISFRPDSHLFPLSNHFFTYYSPFCCIKRNKISAPLNYTSILTHMVSTDTLDEFEIHWKKNGKNFMLILQLI